MKIPNKETKIFISVSRFPGNTGAIFHNTAYSINNLNNLYIPLKLKSIKNLKNILIKFKIKGCSVSMPFKKEATKILDKKNDIVKLTGNTNTIKIKNKKLYGYNTDYLGIKKIFLKYKIKKNIILIGNGSISKTIYTYISRKKIKNIFLCARNKKKYNNWKINKNSKIINWGMRNKLKLDWFINATSIGMSKDVNSMPINKNSLKNYKNYFDIVICEKNLLRSNCINKNINYVSGKELSFYQAIEQFKIYCGIKLNLNKMKKRLKYNF